MIEDMRFETDWVTGKEEQWISLLGHLRGRPARGLEVGVYEGRSSQWWLLNILDHPDSRLVAIDPWGAKSAENRARLALDPKHGHRYEFHASSGQRALAAMFGSGLPPFDFAYIDGGKEAARVLEQSVLTWQLLAPGGICLWDDYRWTWTEGCRSPKPTEPPARAIDAFLDVYGTESEIVHRGWQVAARKREAA